MSCSDWFTHINLFINFRNSYKYGNPRISNIDLCVIRISGYWFRRGNTLKSTFREHQYVTDILYETDQNWANYIDAIIKHGLLDIKVPEVVKIALD